MKILNENIGKNILSILEENIKDDYITCYRSIGLAEFEELLEGNKVQGRYNNENEKQNNSNIKNVVCFFKDKIMWRDSAHCILIECKFSNEEISESGTGQYWAAKNFKDTKIWTGRRGNTNYELDEIYVKEYSLKNVINIYGGINKSIFQFLYERFNDEYANEIIDKLKSLGYDVNVSL